MAKLSTKHIGAHNELAASTWLLRQGYEVFRNVSRHGDVDLIGMLEGKVELFDVKSAVRAADGTILRHKFSKQQIDLGVKCICVFEDGSCEFDKRDLFKGMPRKCIECGKDYVPVAWGSETFCAVACQAENSRKAKLAKKKVGEALL